MKRLRKILVAILAVSLFCGTMPLNNVYAAGTVPVDDTVFTDGAFLTYVSNNLDGNHDGYLDQNEINSIESIVIEDDNIRSLAGIEKFTELKGLSVAGKNIRTINLQGNKELQAFVLAGSSQIEYLNLTNNTELQMLILQNNSSLANLNLRGLSKLETIDARNNYLTRVDISGCVSLISVDVSNNGTLMLDVSSAVYINAAATSGVETIRSGIRTQKLDFGDVKYTLISDVTAGIGVGMSMPSKDGMIPVDISHFGDKTMRNLLIMNYDSNHDLYLSSEEISNITSIRFDNINMVSLTGIEYLTNLKELTINGVEGIGSLDLSSNEALTRIWIDRSPSLSAITLGNKPALTFLRLVNVDSSIAVDLCGCPIQSAAYLYGTATTVNGITNYRVAGSSSTVCLYLDEGVNVTAEVYEREGCWSITSRNFPDATLRTRVATYDSNHDGYLTPEEAASLKAISISNCTSLQGIEHLPNLERIDVSGSELTEIDISTNVNLKYLMLSNTSITTLDITNCPFLIECYEGSRYEGIDYVSYTTRVNSSYLLRYDSGIELIAPVVATPTPTVTATPTATSTPTNTPVPTATDTPVPTVTNTPVPTTDPSSDPVVAFAERLFTCALDREYDEGGRDYWAESLRNGASAADVAHTFMFSVENSEISNEEFIVRLYKTFMGRDGAEVEINYWLELLDNGESKDTIFAGFVNSPEWANLCYQAYLNSGSSVAPSVEREANQAIIAFATRLYTTCLARDGEEAGIDYWSAELANGRASGRAAAHTFFFGTEFTEGNHSDYEFVARLYRTFMGRDGADVEINYWLETIDNGATREDIFNGFVASPEFSDLCSAAGINP